MMKALVKSKPDIGIWLKEVPVPLCKENDVIIKIHNMAICGTDVHIYNWDEWAQATIPVPLTIGHEFSGHIVELGSHVTHCKIGDRVSGEGHITCKRCHFCRSGKQHLCPYTESIGVTRSGAFAEYLRLPAENVIALPDTIDDELGSILDPLGNAVHTALNFNLVGEDVLITGAGPIGIMSIAISKQAGARTVVITDVNEHRLKLAQSMNPSYALNPTTTSIQKVMHHLSIIDGFSIGLEMSGSPTALHQMISTMQHGGQIALLGILPNSTKIDWDKIIFKSLSLNGIYGRQMYATWHKMMHLLDADLDIRNIITHHFKIEEYEAAFHAMRSGLSGKVILSW